MFFFYIKDTLQFHVYLHYLLVNLLCILDSVASAEVFDALRFSSGVMTVYQYHSTS